MDFQKQPIYICINLNIYYEMIPAKSMYRKDLSQLFQLIDQGD
jgi:hypothetical protein